jgi:hypothetical protein
MKKIIYICAVFTTLLVGCTENVERRSSVLDEPSTKQNNKSTTASFSNEIEAENAFLDETGITSKFVIRGENKTWQGVDSLYKQTIVNYATHPKLNVFKKVSFLMLIGQRHSNLALKNDGTEDSKNAIKYYLNELKSISSAQPQVNLHFLKQSENILTPEERKAYAKLALSWTQGDYSSLKQEKESYEALSNLTDEQQAHYKLVKSFVESINAIKVIAEVN